MANRYWVGGSGTWDASSTTNWSATSGGAGGASVPTSADVAIFDANSGAGACTLGATVTTGFLTMTNYTGTLDFSTYNINLAGNALGLFSGGTGYTLAGTKNLVATYSGSNTRSYVGGTPVQANIPNLFVSAGTGGFTMSGRVADLDFTGFSGTLNTGSFNVYGSLNLSATMTVAATANAITFNGVGSNKTITTNGVTVDRAVAFNDAGGSWALADNLTLGASRIFTLTRGAFDANGKNVVIGTLALLLADAKTLTLGSGTWTVAGASWDANTNGANLTVTPGTATINMTSASAKTFAGGGKTWPTLNQGGAGALTIQQANTFTNITNTVQPATITFPASTTTTVGAFEVSGTSGNLITLNSSSAGTQATLSDVSGVNSVSFCDIKDINVTGGAQWRAFPINGNVDSGNNSGWNFVYRYTYTRRKCKRIIPA